jgi:hypothetical protein
LRGADLENVRVVPTFPQRRVAEDELQWPVCTKQSFLVFHDQLINAVVFGASKDKKPRLAWLLGGNFIF